MLTKYVAFLRGINVGGNKKVPMADLKKMLEKLGWKNVKTLLASGNVLFETSDAASTLKKKMEDAFEKKFGFTSNVIFRTAADLEKLVKVDPFKDIPVTENTRLYLTFLEQKHTSKLEIPYVSPDKDFTILKLFPTEVCSVLTLTPGVTTPKAMEFLEKEFGKSVTTRNWNTVLKLLS